MGKFYPKPFINEPRLQIPKPTGTVLVPLNRGILSVVLAIQVYRGYMEGLGSPWIVCSFSLKT